MFLLQMLSVSSCFTLLPVGGGPHSSFPSQGARTAAAPAVFAEPTAVQAMLLELALDAARAFPLDPHVKNRARAEAEVVAAWLDLGQPQRAEAAAAAIPNWRRALALADVGFQHAQAGAPGEAVRCLDLVRELLAAPAVEGEQEWRRDRVADRVAQTEALLLAGSGASARPTAEAVGAQLDALQAFAPNAPFEALQAALAGAVATYGSIYEQPELRERVAAAVVAATGKMPLNVIVELELAMAGHALDHGDAGGARALLATIGTRLDGGRWLPEALIPLRARVAVLRHRAGEAGVARAALDDAMASYRAERDRIVDIWRAGALRPLAEAYHAIGDAATATMVWKFAVTEGATNPNARPRCDDLVATCCSIARAGATPDDDLLVRLREVRAGLKAPW